MYIEGEAEYLTIHSFTHGLISRLIAGEDEIFCRYLCDGFLCHFFSRPFKKLAELRYSNFRPTSYYLLSLDCGWCSTSSGTPRSHEKRSTVHSRLHLSCNYIRPIRRTVIRWKKEKEEKSSPKRTKQSNTHGDQSMDRP